MARNPVTFSNGTLVQKAQVEIGGTTYDVEPAQYEGSTPLSANNINLLQTRLYDYVDEKTTNTVQVYKETVQPNSGYNSQMPINICWKRVGKIVTVDLSVTITKPSAGSVTMGGISSARYSINIPSWAVPSSNYNNIYYNNDENKILLGDIRKFMLNGYTNGSINTSGAYSILLVLYYNKTTGNIEYTGSYANADSDANRTIYASLSYIID